ncbi:MAG: sulfate transporter [Thiotrichaceae bacterium]|nr:MAG: sulfate transporter [Thiotrichaceae bacterium]
MTTQQTTQDEIPRGYMRKGDGTLVPKSMVSERDLNCDKLVKSLIKTANQVQKPLAAFKKTSMQEIQNFIDDSAANYNAKMGGKKGNITVYSFDGRYKIVRCHAENISFDERLQIAKALVDECITKWAKGSRSEIKVLVQDAFQTDRQGKISTSRILGLKRIKIDDPQWQNAMKAISDSIQVIGTKSYIRFYERIGDSEDYTPISLDIAAL